MATIHVPAEKDDISYSHTLKKLFRVNVEKPPDPVRNHGRNFGQTGVSRSSVFSHSAGPDFPANPQARSPNGSHFGPFSASMGRSRDKAGKQQKTSIVPGMPSSGTGNGKGASRRATYHPPPEPPASFMRTAYSAAAPRRRQRRSTSGSTGSNGNGHGESNGNGNCLGHGMNGHGAGVPCKEKSGFSGVIVRPPVATAAATTTATTGAQSSPSIMRRVMSLNGGVLAAAMAADSSGTHNSGCSSGIVGGGSAVSMSWNPHLLGQRIRMHSIGVSNMSYKPPSNVTAEPAAAVLQRRRAAFAASRCGICTPVSPTATLGGSLFLGVGSSAATAGGGGGFGASESLLRASWGSPTGQSPAGPLALQLLTIGLGSSIDMDSCGKRGDGGDGGGDGGGGSLGFGAFGEEGICGGAGGSDSYDNIWLMAGWRGLSTTAEGDAEAVRTAADGSTAEPGALPYYMLPTTSPIVGGNMRRGTGAVVPGMAAAAAAAAAAAEGGGSGGGGGGGFISTLSMKPSIFAPPQQLYMKISDESDDSPGGPIATVATAAAKAGRSPVPPSPSPTPSNMTDRPSLRIPSIDLALLRAPIGAAANAAVISAAGDDGNGGGGGSAVNAIVAGLRPVALVRYDSDLGQICQGDGTDGDDVGGCAATSVDAPAAVTTSTRTQGELLRQGARSSPLQSNPATPLGGPNSLYKVGQSNYVVSPGGIVPASTTGDAGGGGGGGGGGGDAGLTEAQLRAKRRNSARGPQPSLDSEPSTNAASGPYVMGDTTKMLQMGISVAALMEVVRTLGPSQHFATTAEVFEHWLMPATRNSQCRFMDLVMARVKIVLGDPPETSQAPPTPGSRGSYNGMPVLHPDRTWFGQPDHYVIHAWSGNFFALVSALRDYCAVINRTPSSTYVWLDLVAANHHPGRKDKKELPHCKQIMATARKALLVLDPMANSLTRLWCLYEIWLAACAAPGASPSKLTLLNGGADWDAFADSFFRIDLSRCTTANPDDRPKLLEDMIRTSHDAGSYGSSSQHASGTTISPYGVVAALPQLSAAVRTALFEAAAADVLEARRGARGGVNGILALLDAVERYAMIRRLAGGHVEAEEQLEAAVALAMGVSGARNTNSGRPSSLSGKPRISGGGGGNGGGASATGDGSSTTTTTAAAAVKMDSSALVPAPATAWTESGDGGGGGAAAERQPQPPIITLPPIYPSLHTSTTVMSTAASAAAATANATAAAAASVTSATSSSGNHNMKLNPSQSTIRPISAATPPGTTTAKDHNDRLAAAAAAAAAVAATASTATSGLSNAAAWRKRPATLAALAILQAEHGRLIQASTHAAMALSCVPGMVLIRPVAPIDKDGESDDPHEHSGGDRERDRDRSGGGGSRHGQRQSNHGGGIGGGAGGSNRQRSLSTSVLHSLPSTRLRLAGHDSGGSGGSGDADRRSPGGQGRSGGGGGGGGGTATSGQPTVPGEITWKGSYWELTSPQNVPADAARAIFMASIVEAACGRHEAAAQLALQAGLVRAAALGPAHPATLATKRAAVPYLIQLGRLHEAQLLAKSLLREAISEHGELHPSVGICHGAVAMVLAAQDKAELAYSSAQRGAEVLASALGRGHPATLDALQLCADMLEGAREYGKAVALMRLVVKGRSAPGAIRASPASPAFLAPNNRLLHLRTIAALEEKAMSEEQSRRAMIGVMRNLARLETELRAALMAMTGAAAQTQMQIQHDLELVLMAQNKRYEAAMLRKGELRPA